MTMRLSDDDMREINRVAHAEALRVWARLRGLMIVLWVATIGGLCWVVLR